MTICNPNNFHKYQQIILQSPTYVFMNSICQINFNFLPYRAQNNYQTKNIFLKGIFPIYSFLKLLLETIIKLSTSSVYGVLICFAFQREMRLNFCLRRSALKNEASYRGFLESMPYPIMIHSKSEGLVFQNKYSTIQPFCFSKQRLEEQYERIINSSGNSLNILIESAFDRERTQGTAIPTKLFEEDFTANISEDSDSKKIWFNISVFSSPPFMECKDIVTLLFNDVTDKKELEEQRIAEKYKNVLLCSLSHEMRTPVNIVIGILKIIKKEFKDILLKMHSESLLYKQVCSALLSAKALSRKINEMLDLVQLQFNNFILHPEPTDLKDIPRKLIKEYEQEIQPEDVKLLSQLNFDQGSIFSIDQERIFMVLCNLLSNAIKYTYKGSVVIKIQAHSSRLHFEVVDTGVGMTEAQILGLFKINAREENFGILQTLRRSSGLCGMGLYISQQIVGQMGSEIKIESEYSKGSRFWFDIEALPAEIEKKYSGQRELLQNLK